METEIDSLFTTTSYDCMKEPRPESVVYTSIFRELRDLNREAASQLRTPLEDSKFQNGITRGLIKEIAKRTKDDFPDHVKFAIVGDMKAGGYMFSRLEASQQC